MEQWTGSKLGTEYVKALYCLPAYLTSMQNRRNPWQDEAQGRIKIVGRHINNLRYADDNTLMAESRGTKDPPDESKGGKWKSWLNSQLSKKPMSWHLVPSLHGK